MSGFGPLNDGWRNDSSWQPPVNPDAFLPLENTPLDDGSDSWWAGVQGSGVSVPRAATAAALGFSAALCAGLQQQTDEVPSWLPAETSAHASVSQRLRYTTTFKRWEFVDELPGALPVALEESTWPLSVPLAGTSPMQPLWQADELPPLVAALDESAWLLASPPQPAPIYASWLAPDELPLGSPALDEGEWSVPLPQACLVVVSQPLAVEDDLAWLPDDSYWWRGEWLTPALAALPPSGEDEVPVTAQPALDEGYWRAELIPVPTLAQLMLVPSDEVPTVPAALLVDDTLWLAEPPVLAVPVRWVAHAVDEAVPQPVPMLEDSDWAVWTPLQVAPARLVLVDVDELPFVLPSLDDSYWAVPVATAAAAVRLVLSDVDELPVAQPLALEDERWVPGFALVVPPSRLAWVDADVAVTQPAPQVEETYWLTLVNLPSQFYRYDFLAQDDLVPSTSVLESLARTYAVNVEHRGYTVSAEHRQAAQSAEHRTLIVDPQKRSLS